MRHRIGTLLLLLTLLSTSLLPVRAESIQWLTSLNKAMTKAKKQPKLIMVDFYTDWCTWCKRLDTDTYVDGRVVKLASQIYSVKLNAEDGGEGTKWAQRCKVQGFPAIIFLTPQGELFGSIRGYQPPAEFSTNMQKYIQLHLEIPKLKARVQQKDGVAAARLAMLYAAQSKTKEVLPLLKIAETSASKDENLLIAYNTLGATYGMSGSYKEAIPCFEKVIQRTNNGTYKVLARFRIGLCYYSLKQPKQALPYLESVVKDDQAPPQMKKQAERIVQELRWSR